MRTSIMTFAAGICVLCGCADIGPAVSKTNLGNLEINLAATEALDVRAARLFVDNVFIGNISNRMPVLQLKRGRRVVRVELDGAESYSESITILGEPNHQVLNVSLKRKAAP